MLEFQKLCKEVENLNSVQRAVLMQEKAHAVYDGLNNLNLHGMLPFEILAMFIIGSLVSDGSISEKNYLYIYPALLKTFGGKCNLEEIKRRYIVAKDIRKEIKNYTQEMITIISKCDENLTSDIIMLCLLVTSVEGRISLKERRYIKQLCNAQ